ncbi:MAG: phosphotransferase [Acidimicrobiia bacterium]
MAAEDRAVPHASGMAVWSSPGWRAEAVAWLDDQLGAAGMERTGDVTQPHLRPWATALRAPTTAGVVWLKAPGPGTVFEVGLYQLLSRTAGEWVLTPIAADRDRGWILLPDGGPPLGECLAGPGLAEALMDALVAFGRLQRELAVHVDEVLALGVSDMRPAVMPQRFGEALAVIEALVADHGSPGDRDTVRRVAAMETTVASWCEGLAASPVPASIDHNDLHPWNILGQGDAVQFYDWGDSVVAHPFAAMLVPIGYLRGQLDVGQDDPRFLRARDAYLDVFAAGASRAELVATLELACRVAKMARVLTWDRALRAARDQGEAIEERFAMAPLETLAALLDDSYVGGA